ncbi:MAG: hypothetical protein ACKO96_20790, partial [Flammeovirgaceae bacterium]
QANERGRQGRQRFQFMKAHRHRQELEAKIASKGASEMDADIAAIVIQKILEGEIDSTKNLPAYHKIYTVSLFADISGFTKLSESFSKKGRIGPEFLAFSLNRYMEQLSN